MQVILFMDFLQLADTFYLTATEDSNLKGNGIAYIQSIEIKTINHINVAQHIMTIKITNFRS